MPLMTQPLAHLEMLYSDTVAKIEALNIERLKIEARMDSLNEQRYEIRTVIDEEKKKLPYAAAQSEEKK